MIHRVPISGTHFMDEEVPDTHNNEDFWAAWEAWLTHRRAFKKNPYTEHGARCTFRKLARVSCREAIQMIENACEFGWLGVWPLKDGHANNETPKWGTH